MKHSWRGRTVLVTGAGGFIGSHLVERLVTAGAKVRAFVRYTSRNHPGLLSEIEPGVMAEVDLVAGDLRDPDAIQKAVGGCEFVFHLGALIAIPYSYAHPTEVAETNLMGTLNILNACRSQNIARLIHTSTSEVYGTALQVPINEAHPLQGQSPYSASKIGADKLAESYYCSFNLPVVTVRPFNTFGPRQSGRAVLPAIITQALTQSTIHLGNLNTTRDFTYVADTVEGLVRAAEVSGIEGTTLNLGTGEEIRIGDVCQKIIELIGRPVKLQVDPIRLRPDKSEVLRLVSDNSLARERLGWRPATALHQGLILTIDWIRDHLGAFRLGKYEI